MTNMTSKTVKRDQDIDFDAIARWSNEGGAPGPSATLVRKDTAFHWPVTNTEADKRVWRYRKQQLGNRAANTSAGTSHDDSEKELVTQAAQDPRRENMASSVSYDLWRFSCEMPDAPHLCNS